MKKKNADICFHFRCKGLSKSWFDFTTFWLNAICSMSSHYMNHEILIECSAKDQLKANKSAECQLFTKQKPCQIIALFGVCFSSGSHQPKVVYQNVFQSASDCVRMCEWFIFCFDTEVFLVLLFRCQSSQVLTRCPVSTRQNNNNKRKKAKTWRRHKCRCFLFCSDYVIHY